MRNALDTAFEREISDCLTHVLNNARLPTKYATAIDEFARLVYRAWPRDGRRGHHSHSEIAAKLTVACGQIVTPTNIQFMFKGYTYDRNGKRFQSIPRVVAKELVKLALTHWEYDGRRHLPFSEKITASSIDVLGKAMDSAQVSTSVPQTKGAPRVVATNNERDVTHIIVSIVETGVRPIYWEDIQYIMHLFPVESAEGRMPRELLRQVLLFRHQR